MSKFKLTLKEQERLYTLTSKGQMKSRLLAFVFLLYSPLCFIWFSLLEGFPEMWKEYKNANREALRVALLPWEKPNDT